MENVSTYKSEYFARFNIKPRLKTLHSELEGLEFECDRDTNEYEIQSAFADYLYDEYPLLYHSFRLEDLEEQFDVEMDSEYHDYARSSYYYHFDVSEKLEDLFIEHYPEKVI